MSKAGWQLEPLFEASVNARRLVPLFCMFSGKPIDLFAIRVHGLEWMSQQDAGG